MSRSMRLILREVWKGHHLRGAGEGLPPSVYSDVDLTLKKFAPGSQMPFTASLKAPRGGTIKADGMVGPMNPNDTSLTPVQLNLKNDAVEIAGLAPTSGMSGLLNMDAKFQSDGREAQLEGSGQIKNLKATADAVAAKDPLGFTYNAKYNLTSHEGNAVVEHYREKEYGEAIGQLPDARGHGCPHEFERSRHVGG